MAALPVEKLQEISDAIFAVWVKELNFRVTSSDENGIEIWLPFDEAISHVPGVVSGQALLAVADSAMVLALANFYGEFRPVATVDLHMQFLRAAKGNVVCVPKVSRAAKNIAFASVSFYLESDRSQEVGRVFGTFSVSPISNTAEGSKS